MDKKTVCIDLDGTLAQWDGWKGLDHIGDPFPGAVEFVNKLSKKYRIVIYTCRCKYQSDFMETEIIKECDDKVPQQDIKIYLINKVKDWLHKHGFIYDHVYSGHGKPSATAYIDDRAAECNPQTNSMNTMVWYNVMNRIEQLSEIKIL